jgi:hypothetical protein
MVVLKERNAEANLRLSMIRKSIILDLFVTSVAGVS